MGPARFGSCALFLAFLSLAAPTFAQQTTPTPTSDPQAVALVTKALAVLTGGKPITDVTVTGTATRTAGSNVETGGITLRALGPFNSRMDFAGSGGNLTEIRNSLTGVPQGVWVGTDGVSHAMAGHNCMTDAVWFFPAFSILSQIATTNVTATYVGQETRNGGSVQHLRFTTRLPNVPNTAVAFVSSLSMEDIYVDSTSLLPVAVVFNSHSDTNAAVNIATEVDFGGYQDQGGAAVPVKIQELLNGSLFLDISIASADLNSGLPNSVFDLP